MTRDNFTQTPNVLFDRFLKQLSNSELKILLVIIRQTNGWINKKTGGRKEKDRITYSQFILKTGLSRRVISGSIKSLSQRRLIEISDSSGNLLNDASERKGQYRIYYSSLLEALQPFSPINKISAIHDINQCKKRHEHVQNMVHNKRNRIIINVSKEKEADYVHIGKIVEEIKLRWNPK